jgi:regulator of protease activity HflC (stomatin/prohibitin superfamily)
LRERGIKVIASGFGELIPVDEAIYRQRLETWRAPWQKDVEIVRAQQDLEAMRIRSRARAEAQRGLTQSLANILQKQPHSDEIAALRVLQALEAAASDPHTQQLLPSDTITLMRTIHDWLLPGESRFPPPV